MLTSVNQNDTTNVLSTVNGVTTMENASNQPPMSREDAIKAAKRAARAAGREVAAGRMSYTKYVGVLIPLASLSEDDPEREPLILAADAKELWAEWVETEQDSLTPAYANAPSEDGKGNGAAANSSKLKQVLLMANQCTFGEELLQVTMEAIAKAKLDPENKVKSPYPAFVDVCRAQLDAFKANNGERLDDDTIASIVLTKPSEKTEKKHLEQALKALKAAEKINSTPETLQSIARVEERIGAIATEMELADLAARAAKAGRRIV